MIDPGAHLRVLATAASIALLPGCYRSHERGRDAAASIDTGGRCDTSKLRTFGLVEDWAPGSQCFLLVACLDTSEAIDAASTAFPGLTCRDAPDPACADLGRSSCLVDVGRLSEAQYGAACALTLRSDVAALVCSGDL